MPDKFSSSYRLGCYSACGVALILLGLCLVGPERSFGAAAATSTSTAFGEGDVFLDTLIVIPSTSPARATDLQPTYEAQVRFNQTLVRRAEASENLALEGIVVDETMSPQGRTFYADFFQVWRSPAVEGFYTVRVQERPTPGRGTLVQVLVNGRVVSQARLQPQTDRAEEALQAARRTYAYVRSGQGILQIY